MAKSTVKKKGKAKWIILSIILVLVILIGSCAYKTKQAMNQLTSVLGDAQTATVSTRTLIKSVGATGKIKSANKKDIKVDLTGVKFDTIEVAVGDYVEKDQLLISFDTSTIEQNLSDAEEALEKTKKQNELSKNATNRTLTDTTRQAQFTIDTAKDSLNSAKESYDSSVDRLNSSKNQLSDTENQLNKEKANIETLTKEIETQAAVVAGANQTVTNANATVTTATSSYEATLTGKSASEIADGESRNWDSTGEESIKSAYEALITAKSEKNVAEANLVAAQNKLSSLNTSFSKAQTNLVTLQTKLDTLNAAIEQQEESVKQLKKNYESAVKSYNNVVSSQESAIASAKDTVKSSELNLEGSTKTYERQIESYTEQLQNGKLYSPISGVVTAINYSEKDTYQTGTIITVQDTTDMYIESEISEYDIADISVGQKVLIKTDATKDEEMEGTVFFVSPTATQVPGTSATYTVKISLNTPNDRLRLDMSASLSIIIDQHENVLTVPYNAVSTDENGKAFVLLKNSDNTYETVYVTIIMESNYYTEISSDKVKDGDILQIIPSGNSSNYWDSLNEEGFIF